MAKLVSPVLVAILSWIGGMIFQKTFGSGNQMIVMMIHRDDRHSATVDDADEDDTQDDQPHQSRCYPLTSAPVLTPNDVKSIIRYLQTMATTSTKRYMNRTSDELSIFNGGIGFGGVLEMEDPMGGRHHRCLEKYFFEWISRLIYQDWQKLCQLLEQHNTIIDAFFEWLDYSEDVRLPRSSGNSSSSSGNDNVVEVENCPLATFDLRRYKKMTSTERAAHQISLDDNDDDDDDSNTNTVKRSGKFIVRLVNSSSTKQNSNNLTYQFVYGTDHRLYLLDEHEYRPSHIQAGHATIFAGRPIGMAGEMGFVAIAMRDRQPEEVVAPLSSSTDYYRLVWISDSSGHYQPGHRHVQKFYKTLRDRHGVDVNAIQWLVRGQPADFAS